MGEGRSLRVRYFRGWDEPSGAKLADFELTGDGGRWRGRAWRLGETFEVDLSAALATEEQVLPTQTIANVVAGFRNTAICQGAGQIRVRLPTRYLGSLKSAPEGPRAVRLVYECVDPPSFRESIELLESRRIEELGLDRFVDLFHSVFVPDDLGLPLQSDLDRVARSIWEGSAVEGVSGYETRALFHSKAAIGMFCVAREQGQPGGRLGFAGLLPSYRGTHLLASAAKTVERELTRLDAFPITVEIDTRNRRSLRMAERRCGPPKALVTIFEI